MKKSYKRQQFYLHAEGWVTDIWHSRSEQQQWQNEQQISLLSAIQIQVSDWFCI